MTEVEDAQLPPTEPDIPMKKPNSYHLPLLFISYMPTLELKRLTTNAMGAIIPCHSPAQKPAGQASGTLYFDLGPATESGLAMTFL